MEAYAEALMKPKAMWFALPAVVLGFAACGKKETAKTGGTAGTAPVAAEASATPAAEPPAAPVEPAVPALGPEERAAKLGFVKHLPQDTEFVMSLHNGAKAAERIKSGKFWKAVSATAGIDLVPGPEDEMDEAPALEDGADELENDDAEQDLAVDGTAAEPAGEEAADADPGVGEVGPATLFANEFTIALGKGVGDQTANLLTVNRRYSYFQMRMLAKTFSVALKDGDLSKIGEAMDDQFGSGVAKDLLSDPESGIAVLEKLAMPPLYLAFRTNAANRDASAQQIAAAVENLGMLGEMVEKVDVEKAGAAFTGYKIPGAKVAEQMEGSREGLDEMLDKADVDRLIAAVAKRDLVVLSGNIGDYVVMFVGGSADDLRFAESAASSLAGGDALAFCDGYASKEIAAVIHGHKELLDIVGTSGGGLADLAAGLGDGLAASEGGADMRDLETLLRMVGEREAALRKLAGREALNVVAYFEEGLKVEAFGGGDTGAVDWKASNRLASLGDSPDVAVFANLTGNAVYDEAMREYLEALMETAYAASMKVAELPDGDGQLAAFQQAAKTFDKDFRPDLLAMWDAFSGDFSAGLGAETAWIIDLKGTVPTVAGIPQAIVDEGKFPRFSMICPVTDRAKIGGSWEKMNTGATNLLAKVSEMTGKDLPMQKPVSSEKNGLTTWFFPLPFLNDDFMPSVTVGDKWFAASTSKNQALDLIGKADQGGTSRNGLYFAVNFQALQSFSRETAALLEKHAGDLGIEADQVRQAERFTEALDDFDKLTVHCRREPSGLRTSIHFKTR